MCICHTYALNGNQIGSEQIYLLLHIYEESGEHEHIHVHTAKAINWYARTQTIHIFLTDYEKGVKIQRKAIRWTTSLLFHWAEGTLIQLRGVWTVNCLTAAKRTRTNIWACNANNRTQHTSDLKIIIGRGGEGGVWRQVVIYNWQICRRQSRMNCNNDGAGLAAVGLPARFLHENLIDDV